MIDPSGRHGGPIISNVVKQPYRWTTYPERLEKAGVSWRVYRDGIVVGVYPHGIAVSPDGHRAFVANTGPDTGPGGSDTVSVIDTASDRVTGTFTVGQAPQMIAVSAPTARCSMWPTPSVTNSPYWMSEAGRSSGGSPSAGCPGGWR